MANFFKISDSRMVNLDLILHIKYGEGTFYPRDGSAATQRMFCQVVFAGEDETLHLHDKEATALLTKLGALQETPADSPAGPSCGDCNGPTVAQESGSGWCESCKVMTTSDGGVIPF